VLLKRIYAKPEGWEKKVNARGADGKLPDPRKPEGICLNPPPLDHVVVRHTGTAPEQKFSAQTVEIGTREGWLRVRDGRIVLDVKPEALVYTIRRAPGRYCLHCGEKLLDDEKGALARAHVAQEHPGLASPDPSNPAGYEALHAFECVLDAAQHEKFRARGPRRAAAQKAEG
jgi:hypothetical protein